MHRRFRWLALKLHPRQRNALFFTAWSIARIVEIDLGFPALLRQEDFVLGDSPQIARKTKLRKTPDDPFGRIEVPWFHAIPVIVLKLMVIVVITLAEGNERHDKGIPRTAFRGIRLAAKNVAGAVDEEGAVLQSDDPRDACEKKCPQRAAPSVP